MIEYRYRKNKDFKQLSNLGHWFRIGFNFSVFPQYKVDGIIYNANTAEFQKAIEPYKMWEILKQ